MSRYRYTCRVAGCGLPRLAGSAIAMCEAHYLAYYRAANRASYQRRVGVVRKYTRRK